MFTYLLQIKSQQQKVNTSATLQKFASTVVMCERPSGIELWYEFMLENLVTLCLYKSTNAIRLFVATFITLFLQTDKLFLHFLLCHFTSYFYNIMLSTVNYTCK